MAGPTLKYAVIYWASENAYSKVKWLEYKEKIQMTSEDDFFFLTHPYQGCNRRENLDATSVMVGIGLRYLKI